MSCYYFICLAVIRSFARLSETLFRFRFYLSLGSTHRAHERERTRARERKNTGVSATVNKSCLARTNGKQSTDRTAGRPAIVQITHGRKHKTRGRNAEVGFFPLPRLAEENKGSARAENQRIQLKVTVR